MVLRPVFEFPGHPQAVVGSYTHSGTGRSLSGKLFEVGHALIGIWAGVMTLDGSWTRKKSFKHGVHLLIGELKHTNCLTVSNYVVKSRSR